MCEREGIAGFALTEPAPAKINLALHVTGQREDGYHLLDMLVTFTAFGDRIAVSPAQADHFTLSGRFAAALKDDCKDNLVIKARDRLRDALRQRGAAAPPVHLHLEKNLPIASGIGGGSADAAAALRALLNLWGGAHSDHELAGRELEVLALGLGADVPMCLAARPLIARGIGEAIELRTDLPAFPMVLVNPLIGVSTPETFRLLAQKNNPKLKVPKAGTGRPCWLAAMQGMRNDLEAPAIGLAPAIASVKEVLAGSGARLVRMSGSGATCFGIYDTMAAAQHAAGTLAKMQPDWFVVATTSLGTEKLNDAA
ncbi:4-(cytidine 5'-diphospho)-2-C-methyl-D-erythritol kinase [Mycoplana rhizolycopersici]|uniref:4-diphosphocytidyl-2-C-methyl-D-erythritol kinase n=1 Tax=Mycoplana rhizolycopersici TaxID=2746702 RepID=A0ABX2QET6_9HYPH|nr:4-(cytidine 5'-diphospho)-2-C-methyl-D-erythritol kinase [Rhizobium rhizolycopersici]NVP56277.1 4-(cytidine 5'-diphospho)-2-C-methyl-D-erythritol kinase [Rhizobium rhizolycopersici]